MTDEKINPNSQKFLNFLYSELKNKSNKPITIQEIINYINSPEGQTAYFKYERSLPRLTFSKKGAKHITEFIKYGSNRR